LIPESTRTGTFRDFQVDTDTLLFQRCSGANADEKLQKLREVVESRQDRALSRLLSMFCRADTVAKFDVRVYAVTANVAVVFLAIALIAFQIYSSWSEWFFVLLYLMSLALWIWFKRQLKLREQDRAVARGIAELLRVQIAWRLAGLDELVVQRIAPRRVHSFGVMNRLLECATLYCVARRTQTPIDGSALQDANEHWIRNQAAYISGDSMSRKRRKTDRRGRRKHRLMQFVLWVAVFAFAASSTVALGSNMVASVVGVNTLTALLNLLMGASLVALLITELRSSIALDKEDAEAADGVRGLYETAAKQIDDAVSNHQLANGRRVLVELGCAIIDEQAEWHLKHRDGAQVDIIG
jgi:Flp pilus assembly protein TadB